MRVPRYLMRTEASWEAYLGDSATGPLFDAVHPLRGHWEERRRQVTEDEGRVTISVVTFIVDADTTPSVGDKITKDSTTYRVVQVMKNDFGLSGAPSHLELLLTPHEETNR